MCLIFALKIFKNNQILLENKKSNKEKNKKSNNNKLMKSINKKMQMKKKILLKFTKNSKKIKI